MRHDIHTQLLYIVLRDNAHLLGAKVTKEKLKIKNKNVRVNMKKKIKQWVLNKQVIATYKWGRQDDQKDGGIDLNQRCNHAVM